MMERQPNELYASEAVEVLKTWMPTSTADQRETAIAPYLTSPFRIMRLSDMKPAYERLIHFSSYEKELKQQLESPEGAHVMRWHDDGPCPTCDILTLNESAVRPGETTITRPWEEL